MPATLCEAVQATRDLGIRYLWIDALCILQSEYRGDAEAEADWQRESVRMNDVYGGAYLTLVAAGSSDCNGGLFQGRPTCIVPFQDSSIYASGDTRDRKMAVLSLDVGKANRLLLGWNAPDKLHMENEAITSRAWAFQEWLLSSRLLVFTTTGMYFACDAARLPTMHASHRFRLPQSSANVRKSDWNFIVTSFSPRNLSEPSDKLPAISGVAKAYAKICGYALGASDNNYLAGLWRADLLEHLLWCSVCNEALYQPVNYHHGRRMIGARPRAPSWSWAAIDGPVSYLAQGKCAGATMIRCNTRPEAGHDQFGRIESGILVLRCRFVLTSLMRTTPAEGLCLYGEKAANLFFWPDDAEEVAALGDTIKRAPVLYCLWIKTHCGIVVMRTGETGYFRRLGFFLDSFLESDPEGTEREFEIR